MHTKFSPLAWISSTMKIQLTFPKSANSSRTTVLCIRYYRTNFFIIETVATNKIRTLIIIKSTPNF